jgi:uncharacterized peroxidase-related enzyme
MAKLSVIEPGAAQGKTKELLEAVQQKLGRVPNILKSMANSPVALEAYVNLSGVLSQGQLSGREREALALAISEKNGCGYCVAAHTIIGSLQGLDADAAKNSRRGVSPDEKLQSLITLALEVLEGKGHVSETTLERVRAAGYGDAEIAEVVANVALNVYTNFFNHLNQTELDFPAAPPLEG